MSETPSLLGRGAWFNPGPATFVQRRAGWMLLVPGVKRSLVESAWSVLGDPPDAEAVLEKLAAGSEFETEDRLPPVLFALGDGTEVTLGVRGTSPLAVHTPEGCSLLAGTADGPAVISPLTDVRRVAFGDLPAEEPGAALRIVEGMCRVRGFLTMCVDPEDLDDAALTQLQREVEEQGRSIADPEAKERAAQKAAERKAESERREAEREKEAAARPGPSASSRPSGSSTPPPSVTGPRASGAAAAPSMFDDLFSAKTPVDQEHEVGAATPAPEGDAPREPAQAAAPSSLEEPVAQEPAPQEPAPREAAPQGQPAREAESTGPRDAPVAQAPAPTPARSSRLLSSSLFDRRRRPTGTSTVPSSAAPAAPRPVTEGTAASGTSAAASGTPASASEAPGFGASPDPVEDGASSPITRIEPVDAEDAQESPPEETPGRSGSGETSELGAVIGESGGAYDDLFGRTLHRSIEAAAVRCGGEGAEESQEPDAAPAADEEPVRGGDGRAPETTLDAEPFGLEETGTERGSGAEHGAGAEYRTDTDAVPEESTGSDFIDWVPGMRRTTPEVQRTAARARAAVERPAPTPARSPDPAVPDPATGAASTPEVPAPVPASSNGQAPTAPAQPVTLPGTVCVHRHANPPELTRCRWCDAPIEGPVRTVARPPLGLIEISTGGSFLLDRSAIVGRRPRASRVSGDHVPQLITVPSPQQDISRSHLALRLEGWHVLAEDLQTTNGTTLLRAGDQPLRLHPGQSPVLADGDVLDLGDGVRLRLRGRPS
ncbi:hypothetical protein DEO23_15520 [Brachybacterium endophyticum]|uniref:FHA domain-containing protein n=1 Tax=Brachybacterium endophyticum TaxID=2182385 RepID=A0A2U2RGQ2_9MICO|nr:FHA domain-containing protein [Brachybacterium endophyticum]PWH05036.1 hypothetical protein DEO23_15520 [Brachybacterium endophyticum]